MNRKGFVKTLPITAAFVLTLTVCPPGRIARTGPGAAPGDLALAGGKVAGNAQISFAAHSGPNGEDPDGEVNVISLDPTDEKRFHGTVVCLHVSGNQATIIHRIAKSNAPELEGKYQILWVTDNGEPREGESVDTLSSNGYFDAPPPCSFTPGFTVPFDGNITVKDR